MQIGLCSPRWPPTGAANGVVTYVSALRDYFISQDHGVSIISNGRMYDQRGKDVAVAATPPSRAVERLRHQLDRRVDRWCGNLPGIGALVAAEVANACREASIDVVEMEESFGWCDMVRRRTGLPVITRLHGPHFLKPARPRTWRERRLDGHRCAAEGRALRTTRALSAPTRAIMHAAREHYGIEPADLHAVIPNPVAIAPVRSRWRLETCNRDEILMVGRFDYWKGADTMLAAFAQLVETRPQARLILAGPDLGIETAPGRLSSFAEYASVNLSPLVRERVTFTGTLGPDQIATLRQRAYVTVLASRLENLPYALLEAMAAGCPVISTDWPGSDEIVEEGRSGLLTPVGEAAPLAARLAWLMDNPDAACRYARNGFERCNRSYSITAVGGQMLRYYEATLQAGRS